MKQHIVVLTGAGMSAESGLKTFRDADGLWEGHDVMEVASPQGWQSNQALVLEFYNQRRRQLLTVEPNEAHLALAKLEEQYRVSIVTQNVDDLHERAGSQSVLHLHGELLKARSTGNENHVVSWQDDIVTGDQCPEGFQMRPHIVWFGEAVPLFEKAVEIVAQADLLLIVGTSMQVYPAASLMDYLPDHASCYFVDPNPSLESHEKLTVVPEKATKGVVSLVQKWMK